MANVKNFGAEIVGKAIVIGQTTSKYVVVSVDGDNVQTMFYRTEGDTPVPVRMTAQALSKMLESGKLHIEGATTADAPEETVSDNTEETSTEAAVEEASAENVDQEQGSAPEPEPKKKSMAKKNPEPKPEFKSESKSAPKSAPKGTPKSGQYVYGEYKTKRDKTAPKIMGFNEDDYIYQNAALIGGAKTWEYVKVNGRKLKVYTVIFGTRWCDLAHQLTNALNEGASTDELLEIAETAKEAMDTVRAAQKEEYLEKKAEHQAAKAKAEPSPKSAKSAKSAAKTAATSGEKLYTEAEVKARVRKAFTVLANAMNVDVKSFEPIIEAA